MSGRGGRHRGGRNNSNRHRQPTLASVARENAAALPDDSPVLAVFKQAAVILTDRQDRHERLVKLSRDLTIESKRIIFLLHSFATKDTLQIIVQEAKERIQKLIDEPIKSIGLELEQSPAYLHSKAVTAGFQEFIEAYTLCTMIEKKEIIPYAEVQKQFTFTIKEDENTERSVVTLIPEHDYMLGIADLTGEMMRRAINSISSGDSEECYNSCQVVRELYTGFLGLFKPGRELSRKLSTTRANALKVESAVFALAVRGGEAPSSLLLRPSAPPPEWDSHSDDDEGFF